MEQDTFSPEGSSSDSYKPPFETDPDANSYYRVPDDEPPYRRSDRTPTRAAAITSLVCGILGVLFSWTPILSFLGFPLSLVALFLGIRGLRNAEQTGEGKGLATAGLITGIVGTVISFFFSILYIIALWWLQELFSSLANTFSQFFTLFP